MGRGGSILNGRIAKSLKLTRRIDAAQSVAQVLIVVIAKRAPPNASRSASRAQD